MQKVIIQLAAILTIFSSVACAQDRSLKLEMTKDNRIKRLEMINCTYTEIVAVLSAMAQVHIEIDKAPAGTLSTSFENLGWKQALDVMLSPHFFEVKEKSEGRFVVRKRK